MSVVGVTGARKRLPPNLNRWIRKVKSKSALPVCVGFGISGLQSASTVAKVADGVIIGSAIIDIIRKSNGSRRMISNVARFIGQVRKGLNHV